MSGRPIVSAAALLSLLLTAGPGFEAAGAQQAGDHRATKAAVSRAASVAFVESASALGVAQTEPFDLWGLAVADWSGDGCDDLYVGRHKKPPRLYRNGCPGSFENVTASLHLELLDPTRTKDRHAAAFGDYDGDGRLDLFVTTGADGGTGDGDDQLFHQRPEGDFLDVAPVTGITDPEGSGRFGLWFDYDVDGALDLFVGHELRATRAEQNRNILWRNLGAAFANTAAEAGVATSETSRSGVVTDLNTDGNLDLVTVPGKGVSIYMNQGDGTFAQGSLGVSVARSVAAGDYDNDGDVDLFLSRFNSKPALLFRNDGGSWTNATALADLAVVNATAALWLDADNDGLLDLYVVRDPRKREVKPPNLLLLNEGDATFVDVAASAGVTGPTDTTRAKQHTAAWGDFDADGRVDLVVGTNKSSMPVQLYLNRSDTGNSWITLRLIDADSGNRQAIGAEVWITTGVTTQYREIGGATAYQSQSPAYLMVGLGASDRVDTLRIRWPDGAVSVFTELAANRHYAVTRDGLSGGDAPQLDGPPGKGDG